MRRAKPGADTQQRVGHLVSSLRLTIFQWVSRGLFGQHRRVFLTQLTFNLMRKGVLQVAGSHPEYFDFLIRSPKKLDGEENPLDWLTNAQWYSVLALCELDEFTRLSGDLVEASPRFREWFNHVTPETEKLPLDWTGLERTPFLKLLVIRCLRPDRMTMAMDRFVRQVLPDGIAFTECDSALSSKEIIKSCLADSSTTIPLYMIISPGVDVVADVDKLASATDMRRGESYHNVSMGQGQDVVAMERLEHAHRNGHWVILNNIHLMPQWMLELEKKLDEYALEGSHQNFRLFLTSDPSKSVPIGLLNRCIKITNAPPAGLKANLKRAFCSFSKEAVEELESKVKCILFGLCHFHAVITERKLFGPLGFNMMYPFNLGDLHHSVICLQNYMENNSGASIPWQDLRYIFGEIMYGGHIVNDFDRTLAKCYLEFYMKDELLSEAELLPFAKDEKGLSFKAPAPTSYDRMISHIDTEFPMETPIAFGLHPNAEIDFRMAQSSKMFSMIQDLSPLGHGDGDSGSTPQHVAEAMLNDILERVGDKGFDLDDIRSNALDETETVGPFQNVFIQECTLMNALLAELCGSLQTLNLGFAGELTMSEAMEDLSTSLYLDRVPGTWEKQAWPSTRDLSAWVNNLLERFTQLEDWTQAPLDVPRVTWLPGLINPSSFLTAIAQVTAQRNSLELDKLLIQTEVTKSTVEECAAPARDGAFIHGLSMQGARWDREGMTMEKGKPKEMHCSMPVIQCRAVGLEKAEKGGVYECPVYKTALRGPTFVFCAQLKTKSPPARWVLAGVALIMDIV